MRRDRLVVVVMLAAISACGARTPGDTTPPTAGPQPAPGDAPSESVADFDANIVVGEIRSQMSRIKTCYEEALLENATFRGRLVVQFTIEPSGEPRDVHVTEDALGSATLSVCVVVVVRSMRFAPGPEGGSVDFAYPFVFTPTEPPASAL